jgi:hypothetical protein
LDQGQVGQRQQQTVQFFGCEQPFTQQLVTYLTEIRFVEPRAG